MQSPTDPDAALALPTGMLAALVGEVMAYVVCTELEGWVLQRPMEPDAELPSEPQAEQCGSVIPGQTMVGIVARLAYFGKQATHFAWNDALILQAPKQVNLLLFGRSEKTDA